MGRGRPRGGAAVARSSTNQLDAKSKAIAKRATGREKSAGKNYAEDSESGSDMEIDDKKQISPPEQDDYNPSSGEEAAAPKAKAGRGRPAGTAAAGKGSARSARGRPRKNLADDSGSGSDMEIDDKKQISPPEQDDYNPSSGEEAAAPAPKAKAGRGRPAGTAAAGNARSARGRPAVNKSYKELEDSEDAYSDEKPSSPEMVPSDDDDSVSEYIDESSGSEYGKKSKKRKTTAKKSPAKRGGAKRGRKKAGSSSPKKRGRKPASPAKGKNGRKAGGKKKADSEDEEFDSNASASDEEYKVKAVSSSRGTKREAASSPRGGGRKAKPTPKKQNMDLGDEDEDEEMDNADGSDDEKPVKKAAVTKKGKGKQETPKQPARASARKPATSKKISYAEKSGDEDEEEIEESAPKRKAPSTKITTEKKSKVESEQDGEENNMEENSTNEKEKSKDGSDAEEPEAKKSKPSKADEKEEIDSETDEKEVAGNGVNSEEILDEDQHSGEASKAASGEKSAANGGLKNRTDTDFAKLDFTCDKKTEKGEESNLKIASWNVGGVKSWLAKNGMEYLQKESPDIFCMQEIKTSEKTRPESLKTVPNYPHCFWLYAETAGQHGVATFCKTKPISVEYGLPIQESDSEQDKKLKKMFNEEGRLITTEFEKFYLLNTYVPNSGRSITNDSHPKPYPTRICNGERQAWNKYFQDYIKNLDAKKAVIVTGDMNVAHEAIDIANPTTNKSNAGFTVEERDGMTELLEETGLCDSYRLLYPNESGAYTFWSYRTGAREKNVGWRLDYFLVSSKLREGVCESTMRSEVYGSDHCPLVLLAHV